ncbi:MAG: ABC transporter substrate-binding protein [Prevotellaceae bacterium]|nr:ABC transporter substrate-binding protein [Prevotellaceae bacterium]
MLLSVLLLWTGACSAPDGAGKTSGGGDTVAFRHARLLRAVRCDSFVRVDVADAWHRGRTLQTYVLVPRGQRLPESLPRGVVVRTPLERAVAFSAVHASLAAHELQAGEKIAGVCDAAYIVGGDLRRRVADGTWRDFGRSLRPDIEALRAASADALLVSPFENSSHGGLAGAGTAVVECADYMEPTPLGRAEWMRFYGMLFGCEARADSLFADIERRYAALSRRLGATRRRPRVAADLPASPDVWYVPGGTSATGCLLADAAADYAFAGEKTAGGVPVAFERGLAAVASANVWLMRYGRTADFTAETLAAEHPRLATAATAGCALWACNTLRLPYHERLPFRPDRLLEELAAILHPELTGLRKPLFFTRLRKAKSEAGERKN